MVNQYAEFYAGCRNFMKAQITYVSSQKFRKVSMVGDNNKAVLLRSLLKLLTIRLVLNIKLVLVVQICVVPFLASIFTLNAPVHAQSSTPSVEQLEEIIVEEEGEPETPLPLGTGMSGETLRSAPGSAGDPLRTMQSLPGMAFTNDEEAEPAVRGSRPGDNYFQLDFAPSNYIFHFDGAISVFNADLVKSFDIYQSAYGPEFSGVTGGVFDVQLRDPKTNRLQTTVDVSLLQAGAIVEGPISKTQSFYLAGRLSYLDIFLADQIPEEDGVKIEEFPKYNDYQGKYVWKPESGGKLTVQINGAGDTAQIDVADDSEEIDNDPIFAGTFLFDQSFHEQAVRWEQSITDRLDIHSLLSHGVATESGTFGGAGNFKSKTDSFFFKTHANYSLNPKHDLLFGAQVRDGNADLDISISLPPCGELDPGCIFTGSERLESQDKFKFRSYRAFIKDNWYVTDKLTLFPGVAFQQENILDKQFVEPRLAMEYAISDDTIFTAGVGQYRQSPSYLEFDETFGNPSLDYLEALHAQVGVQRFFDNGWSVKSELYYKALDNLVISDEEQQYINGAEGTAVGWDTLIRKDLTNKVSGWAAVSFSKVDRTEKSTGKSFVFEYDQPVNLSLVGKYKFNSRWSVGGKLWVHSGAPYTPVIGANEDADRPGFYRPVYGELNSERFPTYQRLDLRVDLAVQRRGIENLGFYFELLNVLGKENPASYDYNADYTEKEASPQLTGIFSFGFKATY